MGQVGSAAWRSPLPPPPPPPALRACGSDPTQPPPAKSVKASNPAAIDSLGEDLLLDIFLRLPSLASLVRAALTCRAWRAAVASSPSFRRRFRELHPAPLLGVFCDPLPHDDALPAFSPAHRRDRDVLAAIRRGDFHLTSLLEPSVDAPLRWCISDCRDGYLLLMNSDAGLLATVNPLDPHLTDYIDMPYQLDTAVADDPDQGQPIPTFVDVHLISSEEDPMSFRLIWLSHDNSRVEATVFSSHTGDWSFLPWVDIEARTPPQHNNKSWLQPGMQANGLVFWPFKNQEHILMLDTETMEFSVSEFPPYLKARPGYRFVVGETKAGMPCIAFATGMNIGVLTRNVDEDGAERWVLLGDVVRCNEYASQPHNRGTVNIVTIKDGFVYLATPEMVLSFCLETMEFEKLFPRSSSSRHFRPYLMAWPPSLVGNYGKFELLQDDPSI